MTTTHDPWPATASTWQPAGSNTTARKGYLRFAPQWAPDRFRCAFTTAEGWGTFDQTKTANGQTVTLTVRWGRTRLQRLSLAALSGLKIQQAVLKTAGKETALTFDVKDGREEILFAEPITIEAGQNIEIVLSGPRTDG